MIGPSLRHQTSRTTISAGQAGVGSLTTQRNPAYPPAFIPQAQIGGCVMPCSPGFSTPQLAQR